NTQVLLKAIEDGLALLTWKDDSFAYAEGWDSERQRYRGLKAGQNVTVVLDAETVLVKSEVASKQIVKEEAKPLTSGATAQVTAEDPGQMITTTSESEIPQKAILSRFYGTVDLNACRVGKEAGKIADEVL